MKVFIKTSDFSIAKIENEIPVMSGNNYVDKIKVYYDANPTTSRFYPTLNLLKPNNRKVGPITRDSDVTSDDPSEVVTYPLSYTDSDSNVWYYFEFTLSDVTGVIDVIGKYQVTITTNLLNSSSVLVGQRNINVQLNVMAAVTLDNNNIIVYGDNADEVIRNFEETIYGTNGLVAKVAGLELGKVDKSAIYNGFDKTESGCVLDARAGKTLKDSIDSIQALENLTNIVGTYSELQSLIELGQPTTYHLNAKVQVLNDSTHNSNSTLYNLDSLDIVDGLVNNFNWRFVGYYDGYNKEQIDEIITDFEQSVTDNFDELSEQIGGTLEQQNETIAGLGNLQPQGTDNSTNILAFNENKGIYIGTDTGYWYYWDASDSEYKAGGVYQATETPDLSINTNKLAELKDINVIDINDPDVMWGQFISNNSGTISNFRNGGESGYIPINYGDVIRAYKNGVLYDVYTTCALYDSNKELLGVATLRTSLTIVNASAKYIRIPFLIDDLLSVCITKNLEITDYVYNASMNNYLPNLLNNLDNKIDNLLKGIENINVFNPNDSDILFHQYRIGANIANWNNGNGTGYIPVEYGDVIRKYNGNTLIPFNQEPVSIYDENKDIVDTGYVANYSGNFFVINDPAIKYICTLATDSEWSNLMITKTKLQYDKYIPYLYTLTSKPSLIKLLKDLQNSVDGITPNINHWNGKTWYAYGTSITSTAQGKYVPYLAELSGMTAVNKGIPGGGIGDLGGYSHGQVYNAICNITDGKLNADLITFECGANDTAADVPLGTIYDTGTSTLCGCFNDCIRYLQANTTAQIVVIPSIPTKDLPNATDKYYEFQMLMKQMCFINRVEYIDGNDNLGYGRINGNTTYTRDNIHQTDLGGYNLAKSIWSKLKDVPLFYTSIPE